MIYGNHCHVVILTFILAMCFKFFTHHMALMTDLLNDQYFHNFGFCACPGWLVVILQTFRSTNPIACSSGWTPYPLLDSIPNVYLGL